MFLHLFSEVLNYHSIKISGIGTNLACYGGVIPTEKKMDVFSSFVKNIKRKFGLPLPYISGGNSANYNWLMNTPDVGEVNNIRLGEAIFLGCETVNGKPIPKLFSDAFCFIAEVIESKLKPSVPYWTYVVKMHLAKYYPFKIEELLDERLLGLAAKIYSYLD